MNEYIELFPQETGALFKMKELWSYMIYMFSDNKNYIKKIRQAQNLIDYNKEISNLFMEQKIIEGAGLFSKRY